LERSTPSAEERPKRAVGGSVPHPSTEIAMPQKSTAEMKIGLSDLIRIVLREWLETNAYLPVRLIDEES
jgi:hypothetical protein